MHGAISGGWMSFKEQIFSIRIPELTTPYLRYRYKWSDKRIIQCL